VVSFVGREIWWGGEGRPDMETHWLGFCQVLVNWLSSVLVKMVSVCGR
jgi:hypothetical protein